MYVKEILRSKGQEVFRIPKTSTLADVVDELVARNCGSLVVDEAGKMVGIVTERDILRASAARHIPLKDTMLGDVMIRNVITVSPDQKVGDVMGLMTKYRIRHLPVMSDEGELEGIVSIGDVVRAQHAELSTENQFLKDYISG